MLNKFNFNIMTVEEKKTIMVADDDIAVARMSKRILEKSCNVNVITANTVEKGIKIIKKERGNIDLLVSDWDVCDKDEAWAEVIKFAKKVGIGHIIGWSGRAGHESVDSLILEAGADEAIIKNPFIIVNKVRSAIDDL